MTEQALSVQAPGKVVLWGEYAVLAGAPAAVLAVDRYASIHLSTQDHFSSFTSSGYLTGAIHTVARPDIPITSLFVAILEHLDNTQALGQVNCHMDTQAFFLNGKKLGLGSSAALCTALYYAIATKLELIPKLNEAMAIHRSWQGGSGSGLDIAASWHGGVTRFQEGQATPIAWPEGLHFEVFFTGSSASTQHQIRGFSEWRSANDTKTLDELCRHSENLFSNPNNEDNWHTYIAALRAIDAAGSLNIFTQEHERLATIASDLNVVYKPCGAGGGDIGIALSDDPSRLSEFRQQATQADFTSLQTEIAKHGIEARPEVE